MADVDPAAVKKRKTGGRRSEASQAESDTPDPIEIAMKAVATGADRHGAARAVLEKHASLIDKQCAREDEELRILRLRRFTRWLVLAAALLLVLGIGYAVRAASRSSVLIIEPFNVPPTLERRGLNGRVVSARVLDRLAELQRRTESMRGEQSYAETWSDEIKIAIPETGVSVGDAWRALRTWLGEETRISGEIVETPTGLAVSIRAGRRAGTPVEGRAEEVDRLIGEAARSIYKVTQPYRYAISLGDSEHAERIQVLLGLTGDPSPVERKWAYSGLSVQYRGRGDLAAAVAAAERALAIDPEHLAALGNLSSAHFFLGHDEEMLRLTRHRRTINGAEGEYDERLKALNSTSDDAFEGLLLKDPGRVAQALARREQLGAFRTSAQGNAELRAGIAELKHEHRRAAAFLAPLVVDKDPVTTVARRAGYHAQELRAAGDLGDAAAVRRSAAGLDAATAGLPDYTGRAATLRRRASAAENFARVGLAREAAVRAASLPDDCYPCRRAKGWAALANGNTAAAAGAFEAAARFAPSAPDAFLDLGILRLRAGDAAGAVPYLRQANAKAPSWADPLKSWGDALRLQRQAPLALEKYEAAAARAPRWGALHLAWADALWSAGRRSEARSKLAAASAMDLGPRDRFVLAKMKAKAGTG